MQMLDASGKSVNPRVRQKTASLELNATESLQEEGSNLKKVGEVDGRVRNRGSANRTTYSSKDKWKHIEQFEMWFEHK